MPTKRKTHPNRNRKSPTPEQIIAARTESDLTQEQAAALVHSRVNSWQQWEAPTTSPHHRRMHPAFFELFNMKRNMTATKEA